MDATGAADTPLGMCTVSLPNWSRNSRCSWRDTAMRPWGTLADIHAAVVSTACAGRLHLARWSSRPWIVTTTREPGRRRAIGADRHGPRAW